MLIHKRPIMRNEFYIGNICYAVMGIGLPLDAA